MDNLLLVQHICTAQLEIQIYQIKPETKKYILVAFTDPLAFLKLGCEPLYRPIEEKTVKEVTFSP